MARKGVWNEKRFDTVSDFIAYATGDYEGFETVMPGRSKDSRQEISHGFNLDNWENTVQFSRVGWKAGRERVERLSAKLESIVSGQIPVMSVNYDVTGDWLDVGRFMSGEPEVFGTLVDSGMRLDATVPKIIRIVANLCISGSMNQTTLQMRGAAIVALADMLEKHGIRCQIDMVAINDAVSSSRKSDIYVRVKEANESLQIDSLAFILAHPDSFRRLMFSTWERVCTEGNSPLSWGYGQVGDLPEGDSDRGDIYLAGHESAYSWSEAATLLWIKKNLREQGINLEEETNGSL